MLSILDSIFDKISSIIGNIAVIAVLLLIVNVFLDAMMRYFVGSGSIAMQEMEWHLFSVVILLGISYTFTHDAHVRVDLFYENFSPKIKAIINIIGICLFVFPLAFLIIYGSLDFVLESFNNNEISSDPGGLTHRYLIKALIPISFIFLIITSIGMIIKNIIILKHQ